MHRLNPEAKETIIMRFPYGIADFRKIREEGYFYVDRTDRIWSGSHAPAWEQVQTLQRPQ